MSQILPIFYFLIDVLILVFAFSVSDQLLDENNYQHSKELSLAIAITLWAGIGYARNLYKSNLHNGFHLRMISYSKTYLIFAIALIFITFIVFEYPAEVYKSLLSFAVVFLGMNITLNTILINAISLWRRRAQNIKSTLVIGVGDQAVRISSYFESNPDFGFRIRGYLKEITEETKVPQEKVIGPIRNLKRFLKQNPIDEIVIALPYKSATRKVNHIVEQADLYGIRVSFLPDYHGLFGKHYKIVHDREFEAVNVRQLPLDEFYPLIEKTIFDFVF
ncbi:MAG TPA: hypothetical protein VFO54_00770, partial [Chryseosolibacter sp.]|nr:hypothetical protein [Chryseosolibacter sp.]